MMIEVELTCAPGSPLNLRFGVVYAPRIETPPFVGFEAVDAGRYCIVKAYDLNKRATEVFRGGFAEAWVRLATHLRMDQ